MKKNNIHYIIWLGVSLVLLAGCATSRQEGKKLSVTPSSYVLVPDSANCVKIDLCFDISQDYFSKRSRLVIAPQLWVNDSVKDEYIPLVLDAPIYYKKKKRQEKLIGYSDPYGEQAMTLDSSIVSRYGNSIRLPYHETVELPEGTDNARIVAVVSTDGCGKCTGIDTIDVATIQMPELPTLLVRWIEPQFVIRPKVMEGRGVAHLQFTINKYDINLTLGNNRKEMENMEQALSPILQDTLATLTTFSIYGMASADGSLAFNTRLSENRANAAKQWLVTRLNVPTRVQRLIITGSRPEGWQPVLEAMIADGNPDTTSVRTILEKYNDSNDDVQERYIRRLPSWNQIKERYLQKDRKVEYTYAYVIKSFTTDAELLDMYRKRPDAFNEDELLRVATLMTTDREKMEVYRTVLGYFPQSESALNNLAVLYLHIGNEKKARELLRQLPGRYPNLDGSQLKTEE